GFTQYRNLPERVPVDWSPAFLMTGGPYAVSRHPMYVAELALWLGGAILYGSIPVLIGLAALGAGGAPPAARGGRGLGAECGEGEGGLPPVQGASPAVGWGRSPGSGAGPTRCCT